MRSGVPATQRNGVRADSDQENGKQFAMKNVRLDSVSGSQREMKATTQPVEFTLQPTPESTWEFLAFAWRRKGLVLFAVMTGLGIGYLYFLQQEPSYRSTTEILIVEERAKLPIEGVEMSTSSAAIHIALLRSQRVVQLAVEKLNDGPFAANGRTPISEAAVMGGLSVSGDGTNSGAILRLSFGSTNRNECPIVLEAVVSAYREFLDEMYNKASHDTIELIEQAKNQLESQISATEKLYRDARNASPLMVTGETAQSIHEMRLQQIEQVRSEALLDNSKLRAQIDALTTALEQGRSREALNLIVGHQARFGALADSAYPSTDPNQQRKSELFPLLLEEQLLLENHGVDHPKVLAVRKRIELTRQYLAGDAVKQSARAAEPMMGTEEYYQVYLDSLRERIKMNDQLVSEMDERFRIESASAKEQLKHLLAEETFRSEIDRKSRLFDVVLKRLEEINLVKARGGADVESIHSPGPAAQTKPDFKSTMLTSGILAFMCGLGLAFVVNSADRRFRSPEEIRDDLGVSVVGHIPLIPTTGKKAQEVEVNDSQITPEVCAVHVPRGRVAEAYRAVRTAIYFSIRGGGHQVIQVTSPNPGDGKTTLAANLAVSIAHSGKSVLLIDADFRRPRCHAVFGVENKVGMSAVIEGTVEIQDAIQATEIEHLSLLTCGKRPENPSELLTSRRFEELLDVLRAQYELVIVDTPPVLAVTDPLNVAPRVDGVLLVLRLTKNARHSGHRTLESLAEVGANVLGVVVNGVGASTKYGGYGNSKNGYGYGGKYNGYGGRYGDANGYRESDDQSYYVDDANDASETHNAGIATRDEDRPR